MEEEILAIEPVTSRSEPSRREKIFEAYAKMQEDISNSLAWSGLVIPQNVQVRCLRLLTSTDEAAVVAKNIQRVRKEHEAASLYHHLRRSRTKPSAREIANIRQI